MQELKDQITETWWIAHNDDYSVIHYGSVEVGQIVTTGQPILDTYSTKDAWKTILAEYNIDPDEMING